MKQRIRVFGKVLTQSRWQMRVLRYIIVSLVYLAFWYGLDLIAFRFETAPEIQIWYPPSALDIVLLLVFGLRYAPITLLNAFIHVFFVTHRQIDISTLVVLDLATTLGYTAACMILLRIARINPRLRTLRDVRWFILIASALAPLIVALLQVLNFVVAGIVPQAEALLRVLQYWAGDATGIAMLAPVLLVLMRQVSSLWVTPDSPTISPLPQRHSRQLSKQLLLDYGMLLFTVVLAYGGERGVDLDYTYLVFAPLIWITIRHEFIWSALAVLVINVGAALLSVPYIKETNGLALQFGLMSVSQMGILLGAYMVERRRSAEERRIFDQRLLLIQKRESLGALAGRVSHDFNNLLTTIGGYTQLAKLELPTPTPATESLDQIEIAIKRASELTRQLLTYAGKHNVVLQRCTLNDLVAEMLMLLKTSINPAITIQIDFAPDLPSVAVDQTQIRQVILNLIINAAEAIGEQVGVISVSTASQTVSRSELAQAVVGSELAAGCYVSLRVADSGKGMNAATLANIFDPFFSTKPTGHGLGLTAVLGIVQGHGGALHVLSEPNLGTIFTMLLPPLSPEF